MTHPADRDNPVSVVDRIAAIVNCVADQQQPVSISRVAKLTNLPKSTTARIVRSLIPHGLLELQQEGLVLGLRFFELGERASRPRSLRRLTYAYMLRLQRETGQTIHLAVLDDRYVVYIEILRARNSAGMRSYIGGRLPAHATGVGKALLAFSDPEVAEKAIESGLERLGPNTLTDPEALRAELWRVRAQGYAYEQEESGPETACVAMPIFIPGDTVPIAALSISGKASDINLDAVQTILSQSVTALNKQAYRLPEHRQRL